MATEEQRQQVLDEIKEAIIEKLGVKNEALITFGASYTDDLGADSLDVVELVMEFEDVTGLKIPDDDIKQITTVGDTVDYIIRKRENPDPE